MPIVDEERYSFQPIQCFTCVHLRPYTRCDAFPDGIPPEIIAGRDHREPYPGDNGIRYEEIPDDSRMSEREWLRGGDADPNAEA